MPDVIDLKQFQRSRTRSRVQEALELMYVEIFYQLQHSPTPIDSGLLERLLVDVVADHVAGESAGSEDLEQIAERYCAFEGKIRKAVFERLAVRG